MYQSPKDYTPQPYGQVAPYEMPRPARRRVVKAPVLLLLPLLFFGFMFFGFSYLVSPEPDVEIKPGVGFAAVNGRQAVLVPYERHGARGMFQLMVRDLFQVRLAATDPATGDVLWDVQLSDELVWDARVLAAGERYAYVATGSGLVIVDLHDGALVARGSDVQGLGGSYVAAPSAYGYDPDDRRVLAMTATGAVLALPLDEVVATPTDQATTAVWLATLSARPTTTPATSNRAALGAGDRVELRPRPAGGPGGVLVRVGADGTETRVGDTPFHGASIVLDGATAAGSVSGHVLVKHNRTVNDTGTEISAVSLTTGAVTGSLAVDSSPQRAVTREDGTAVIAAGGVLVTSGPDGRVTAVPVGATDFLGNPS
ncbi:PA2928 family protein [Umezawaea sp.]|uniref:PA2928 family protein n=1 Tax=Umezawaea sp. TaxID=1955258 RepID=UPI002ED6BE99